MSVLRTRVLHADDRIGGSPATRSTLPSTRKHLSDCNVAVILGDRTDTTVSQVLEQVMEPLNTRNEGGSMKCKSFAMFSILTQPARIVSILEKFDVSKIDIAVFLNGTFENENNQLIRELRAANPNIYIVMLGLTPTDVGKGVADLVLHKHSVNVPALLVAMLCNDPLSAVKAPTSTRKINNVLVVDDDHIWKGILSRTVKRTGREFSVAEDLESALKLFAEQKFDLVITDRDKGDIHYGDAIAMKARELGIPCVMVSGGKPKEGVAKLFVRLSLCEFFDKGVDKSEDFIPKLIAKLELGK
ncbi:MAG: response regulator [Candidatus Micrarchaeota archaeon]|nr:response regulator [Candidatus Micrarchaeota archaeon]